MKSIISECYEEYSFINQEKNSFGLGWSSLNNSLLFDSNIYGSFLYTDSNQIDSYPYTAVRNTYMGGGYVFKMKGDSSSISNQTQILEQLEWIDKQTVAVFVEFTLFNPNINLFHSCLIVFEILNTGNFLNSAQFKPIDLNNLSNSGLLAFNILINIIYLIFVCLFMIREIRELMRKKLKYFYDLYNYIDLIIIGFSWAAFAFYLYMLYATKEIYSQIRDKSTLFTDKFINLQYLTTCSDFFNSFLGFCAAFATLRFIKLLRFNKRIIVFLAAFKKSFSELVSFGLVFLILWMSFIQAMYLILNDETYAFSSIQNSMITGFEIILGKFNSQIFYNAESKLAPCLFVAYNICVIFVMVNIFISILIEGFNLAREDTQLDEEDPELLNYLKSILKSIFCFLRYDEAVTNKKPVYFEFWASLPNTFDNYTQRFKNLVKY